MCLKNMYWFNRIEVNSDIAPAVATENAKWLLPKIMLNVKINNSAMPNDISVPRARWNKLLYILIVSLTGLKCDEALFSI